MFGLGIHIGLEHTVTYMKIFKLNTIRIWLGFQFSGYDFHFASPTTPNLYLHICLISKHPCQQLSNLAEGSQD